MSRYCHLGARPWVSAGDTVALGQIIGMVGSSGHSMGPHLHFEIHRNGGQHPDTAINPIDFFTSHGVDVSDGVGG